VPRIPVIALLLLLLAPRPEAQAESSDVTQAKEHFGAGRQSFDQQDYRAALRHFTRAYAQWSNRVFHFNIAMCHAHLNEPVAAVRHLRQYLLGATPEERELPEILRRVQAQVGLLIVRTPLAEAAISIDGQVVGLGEVAWVVAPGDHAVEIRREGQVVLRRRLSVAAAREARWEVQAVPRPVPKVIVVPREPRKLEAAWFASVLAVSAASFGVSLGLYFKTEQLHRDFRTTFATSLRDEGLRYQNATNAMLSVSLGALLTAGVLALFTRWRRRPERPVGVTVAPPTFGQGVVFGVDWPR
jgi:hypothetical protein